jgi:protein phosphatase
MSEQISNSALESILAIYSKTITNANQSLTLPSLPFPLLSRLLSSASFVFGSEPSLLRLTGDFVVIGDLHGHILDFLRILREFGFPPKTRYLFLGDLVDRGEFSIETVVLVLVLKQLFPESIYVVRGNHEFSEMWNSGGFNANLEALYPSRNARDDFSRVFSQLPLAAVVNGTTLCLHGGIGPNFTLDELAKVERPIRDFRGYTVSDAVWSDPCEDTDLFLANPRGLGCLFGASALDCFFEANGITLLVRGHEAVDGGCLSQLGGRVLTVFSASGYCGGTNNCSGVVLLSEERKPMTRMFPAIPYRTRSSARFVFCRDTTVHPRMTPRRPSRDRTIPMPSLKQGSGKSDRIQIRVRHFPNLRNAAKRDFTMNAAARCRVTRPGSSLPRLCAV